MKRSVLGGWLAAGCLCSVAGALDESCALPSLQDPSEGLRIEICVGHLCDVETVVLTLDDPSRAIAQVIAGDLESAGFIRVVESNEPDMALADLFVRLSTSQRQDGSFDVDVQVSTRCEKPHEPLQE